MDNKKQLKNVGGSAGSFHVDYLRANMVGQNYKGSTVTEVTRKYIVTEDAKYKRAGANVNFKEVNPDAGGDNITRRD